MTVLKNLLSRKIKLLVTILIAFMLIEPLCAYDNSQEIEAIDSTISSLSQEFEHAVAKSYPVDPASLKPVITVQQGLSGGVDSLCTSLDGRYLAWNQNSQVCLADLETGRSFARINVSIYLDPCFTVSGKYLVIGENSTTLAVVDVSSGKVAMRKKFPDNYSICKIVSGGAKAFVKIAAKDKNNSEYALVDTFTGTVEESFFRGDMGYDAAYSRDGRYCAFVNDKTELVILDTAKMNTDANTVTIRDSGFTDLTDLTFSNSGKLLAGRTTSSLIGLINWEYNKKVQIFATPSICEGISFSHDDSLLAFPQRGLFSNEGNNVLLYEISSGKALKAFPEQMRDYSNHKCVFIGKTHDYIVADGKTNNYYADGKAVSMSYRMVRVSGENGQGHDLFWSVNAPHFLRLSPSGQLMAPTNRGLLSIQTNTLRLTRNEIIGCGRLTAMDRACTQFATLSESGKKLEVREIATGNVLTSQTWQGKDVNSLAMAPSGKVLALAQYGSRIDFVNPENGKKLGSGCKLTKNTNSPRLLTFTSDSVLFAESDWTLYCIKDNGKTVQVCKNLTSKKALRNLVVISEKNLLVAHCTDNFLTKDEKDLLLFFDATTGEQLSKYDVYLPRLPDFGYIKNIQPDPSAKELIILYSNGVCFFDYEAKKISSTVLLPGNFTECVFLNPNVLATSNDQGQIQYWNISERKLIATMVCSDGEWISYTPEGYFSGTENAGKKLVFVAEGKRTTPIDQFYELFYRPDLVAAKIAGNVPKEQQLANLENGFASPPVVKLTIMAKGGTFKEPAEAIDVRGIAVSPVSAEAWNVENGYLSVRVVAQDSGGGIDGVRLMAGGKAVGEDVRGITVSKNDGVYTRDFKVPLSSGENRISAIGFSRDRTESRPTEIRVTYRPVSVEKSNLYVITAGADAYRNTRYNLNFAIADAKGFASAINAVSQKLFGRVELVELYDSGLTRAAVIDAFAAIAAKAKADDVFIFFYAGHGIARQQGDRNQFWFVFPGVTQMEDDKRLSAEGLNSAELRDFTARIPAKKQMLLIDACNSGALIEGFCFRGAAEENALAQLQRSAGLALISASTDQQFAGEVKDLGHGLFTYSILQGLKGSASTSDGRITASSLRTWIDNDVPNLARKYRGSEQFPLALVSGQDFPIGMK